VIGGVFLVFVPIPWILGNFIILAAGSGESVSVRQTGMVTCPEVLHWSKWNVGSGSVTNHEDRFDEKAEIIEYRIGIDKKLFAQLTFYQAKYRLPDGRIEIGPARGPVAFISVDAPRAVACSLVAGVISLLCFWRRGPSPT
jgi:hypothetical protein